MKKVLANDGLSPAGIARLEAAGFSVDTTKVAQEQLAQHITDEQVDALLVRSATKVRADLIDQVKGQLKFIGRGGVGMDNIDVEYAREQGILVHNTPAASTRSVAELVMAHLSGMVRFLHDSNRQMPLEGETRFKELKKAYGKGTELQGATLGIIGAGRIGQEVAKIAYGIGMKVVAHDPYQEEVNLELAFADEQTITTSLPLLNIPELLQQSDFISIHVGGAGKALLGEAELAQMKPGAGLINTSRGGMIDEEALLKAIEDKHIAFAALDVFENEPTPKMALLMNPALSLTPHIGAATLEAQERIGLEIADLIIEKLG